MNYYNAEKACKATLPEVAGISGVTWRLPSKKRYEQAEKNGIRRALPNMDDDFWTSSVITNHPRNAWLFHGHNGYTRYAGGYTYYGNRSDSESVRCVAR